MQGSKQNFLDTCIVSLRRRYHFSPRTNQTSNYVDTAVTNSFFFLSTFLGLLYIQLSDRQNIWEKIRQVYSSEVFNIHIHGIPGTSGRHDTGRISFQVWVFFLSYYRAVSPPRFACYVLCNSIGIFGVLRVEWLRRCCSFIKFTAELWIGTSPQNKWRMGRGRGAWPLSVPRASISREN